MKKILILLTTSAALSASLVSLNSCGNKSAVEKIRSTEFPFELAGTAAGVASSGGNKKVLRFDTENDHVIVLDTALSATHPGFFALKDIVARWNSEPGRDYKVEIKNTAGGYDAQTGLYENKLRAKDKKTLPNLWLGYADSAAIANKYNMLLNMESEGFDQKLFNKDIIQINDHIQNLQPGGLSLIPFAKTSESLYVNKSALAKLVKMLGTIPTPTTADVSYAIWQRIIDASKTDIPSGDTSAVPDWMTGTLDSSATTNLITMIQEKGNKIFTNWDYLLEFSTEVAKAFKISNLQQQRVLAVDSPDNMAMNMAKLYSLNADKPKQGEFFYNLSTDNKHLNWTSLSSKTNPGAAYSSGEQAWNKISEAVKSGGVKLLSKGEYGSIGFRSGQFLMALGSTAGTTFNLSSNNQKTYLISKVKTNPFTPTEYLVGTELAYTGDTCSGTHTFGLGISLPNGDYVCSTDKNAAEVLGAVREIFTETPKPNYHVAYAVPLTSLTTYAQRNSVDHDLFLKMPNSIGDGHEKLIYGQGPNLQAMHANAGEDAAVKVFVKWLFTNNKDSVTFGTGSHSTNMPANTSPVDYFNMKSNYISATNDILNKTPSAATEIGSTLIVDSSTGVLQKDVNKYLVGPSIAFQTFKLLTTTPSPTVHYNYFISDTGVVTGEFRSNLGDALRGLTTSFRTGHSLDSYEDFILNQISWAQQYGYLED